VLEELLPQNGSKVTRPRAATCSNLAMIQSSDSARGGIARPLTFLQVRRVMSVVPYTKSRLHQAYNRESRAVFHDWPSLATRRCDDLSSKGCWPIKLQLACRYDAQMFAAPFLSIIRSREYRHNFEYTREYSEHCRCAGQRVRRARGGLAALISDQLYNYADTTRAFPQASRASAR